MIINTRLAGGISTLKSGFMIGDVEPESHEIDVDIPKWLLINPNGDCIGMFWEDKRQKIRHDCDRAELEAVQGFKKLILKW